MANSKVVIMSENCRNDFEHAGAFLRQIRVLIIWQVALKKTRETLPI